MHWLTLSDRRSAGDALNSCASECLLRSVILFKRLVKTIKDNRGIDPIKLKPPKVSDGLR
jgi:hypothetical protein